MLLLFFCCYQTLLGYFNSLKQSGYKLFLLGFWPFAKVSPREYEPYFEFVKVFSAEFVPKIVKRESFVKYFAFSLTRES